jgi:hypothetical protein
MNTSQKCWERKWTLTHLPLLTRSYIMVTRRQMGRCANPYALVHIHANRYVRQHPRVTPECMSHTFPPTTRGNVRQRLHQHLDGLMYPEEDRQATEKGLVIPTLFTKFNLNKCLFVISMDIPRQKVAKESTRSTNVEIQHFVKRDMKRKTLPLREREGRTKDARLRERSDRTMSLSETSVPD